MCKDAKQKYCQLNFHPSLAVLKKAEIEEVATKTVPNKSDHATREQPLSVIIVIPVHNRKAISLQCLQNLHEIDRTGLDVHIIIVDDGSTDGTGDAVREQFPGVEILQGDGNLHYTKGTNLGVRRALQRRPDYILAMNDDSILHEQFLRIMVRCAQEHPKSVVGALLIRWDKPYQLHQNDPQWDIWYGGRRWPQHRTVWSVPKSPWIVQFIPGNCVLFPRAAIEQVGLMNERAFPYSDGDAEYILRLSKAGWKLLIESNARVWCQPNRTHPPWDQMPKRLLLRELVWDRQSRRNLIQIFLRTLYGAPSRPIGLLTFGVCMIRRVLKVFKNSRPKHNLRNTEGNN
ncbi:glycosyltransferase family 2 protein [Desulfobacterota bacterium AH_259_B03_O07]|nr:glycosyltransferase family 2 protein [Desulfobacterota bacterium AH_259_B03_O07]